MISTTLTTADTTHSSPSLLRSLLPTHPPLHSCPSFALLLLLLLLPHTADQTAHRHVKVKGEGGGGGEGVQPEEGICRLREAAKLTVTPRGSSLRRIFVLSQFLSFFSFFLERELCFDVICSVFSVVMWIFLSFCLFFSPSVFS